MREPIKAGDKALVVDGALKSKSPNIGKTVTVNSLQGEHSKLGRIWRCSAPDLMQFDGSMGGSADFAASWLQKIDPTPLTKTQTTENEVTA